MKQFISGMFWLVLYLLLVLVPMFVMMIEPPPGRHFWVELSIALGFIGLTQMALQFTLIARYHKLTEPYGIDHIMQYHRQIAMMSFVLILAHPALLAIQNPKLLPLLNPFGGTWASRTGVGAVIALAALVIMSVFRRRLRIDYEWWRITHTLFGVTALVLAHVHVSLVAGYLNTPWKQVLWKVLGLAMVSSLVYLRLIKPGMQKRRRYRVAHIMEDRGNNFTLALEPVGHGGMRFLPGQFAWLKLGTSPYTIEEHPFSFSSSAESEGRVEFGIKALGDFTRDLRNVAPGIDAWLDGPYGSLSIDLLPAAGYVFIAGGIGITPMLCLLKTMADRDDKRPVLLIYGARQWNGMAFRDDIEQLRSRMNLSVVLVLEERPADWQGETGLLTTALLARHLPQEKIQRNYFVCGPTPMMDAVQESLIALGVPRSAIHSERFDLI